MDETRLVYNKTPTAMVAQRNTSFVPNGFFSDKEGVGIMSGITMAGDKLPPYVIATGTTQRCHNQYMIPGVHVGHSPSGWCNQTIMLDY